MLRAWAAARLGAGLQLCVGIKGLEIGFPEQQAIGAALLLATGKPAGTAGGTVKVEGDVGLVFWQAHRAGAGCHEVSQKAEPRISGVRDG